MIDLHMHTTASDGRLSPADLVARTTSAGLTTISVTDHDTVAAMAEARRHAAANNVTFVAGVEITAVHAEHDVHILGYFIDDANRALQRFLEGQRTSRVERVREMARQLARLGAPVDVERLFAEISATPGASIGRPALARALVRTNHVQSLQEAFDRFLSDGRPAFVPRTGPPPPYVVDVIHAAGGLASLAHPGVTGQPELLEPLAAHGLDAIEAYHTDHTPIMREEALAAARRLNLAVTGGSDYHGDDIRRPLGGVTLPPAEYEAFASRKA